jgi:hypothetical protein
MPKHPKLDRTRERRILDEIVVDAYGPEERAMGWYCFLEDKIAFPFTAKCVAERSVSPLKKGEEVEVLGLAKEDDCMAEIFVLIRFAGRKLGVPLSQVEAVEGKLETREAVEDWHYWVTMSYTF